MDEGRRVVEAGVRRPAGLSEMQEGGQAVGADVAQLASHQRDAPQRDD
jgi:hypothetical protein